MRSVVIGGGPAGLYYGILTRKRDPSHEVVIYERNRAGDTFGWGVVFSDATLGTLEAADAESYREIKASFAYWSDIDVFLEDQHVRSTGHGFCGLKRVQLLDILERRAVALGVRVVHEVDVDDLDTLTAGADFVLAADGVNSRVRNRYAETFQPELDWRKCRFIWLGTTRVFDAFTFIFRSTPHGLYQVHAYPFDAHTSTFIVECRDETLKAEGLEGRSEAETLAFFEKLFAPELAGAALLTNNSVWRTFPTIRCARWRRGNTLLIGDAVHTAHFSIGSGTKLAMEDAIALDAAFAAHPTDVDAALTAYEAVRRPEVERIQAAAQTSLEWFENAARYVGFDPLPFTFSLMTRSKRITWDELGLRDPGLMTAVRDDWAHHHDGATLPAFTPYTLRGLTLPNRIVVSPMCQYSATDGVPDDWHLVHLGSRAVGGAGLVMAEATGISPEGRITPGCTGMWNDTQAAGWRRVVDFVHGHSAAKIGLQIGHAGRKASCHVPWEHGGRPLPPEAAWEVLAPSAVPYDDGSPTPRAMDRADMDKVVADFVAAARRAEAVGFDLLELHFAHGYLIHTFYSALTNLRTDAYGGALEARMRFPLEIVTAVRAVWPAHKPLSCRISATEWAPGGLDDADRVWIARALHGAGVDVIDVSGGGAVPWQKPVYGRMFQLPFSDLIRNVAGVPTMTVGNVQDVDQINTILAAGRADLVAMARAHLTDPYAALHAAARYEAEVPWPRQYLAVKPGKRKG